MSLTVGSLFSGIGGLDLGLERAGMRVRWQSEIDPYASRVLAKHWPAVPNLGDIKLIDWSTVEPVDLICGGYPCQPFSYAGARNGATDPRHLWPFFLAAVRHLRPRWALLENVSGHLSLGFGRVLGDLAESGYDVEWDCIPAAGVGAPHRRDRVFGIAHADSEGEPGDPVDAVTGPGELVSNTSRPELRLEPVAEFRGSGTALARDDGSQGPVAHPEVVSERERADEAHAVARGRDAWPKPRRRSWWSSEPDVGRVADGVPARVDRLRCLGNAVVPQVAEFVGRRILEASRG